MGSTSAANIATRLVRELSPRCLAMCGICAGRRGKVSLGDVIVADLAFDYEAGKVKAFQDDKGRRQETIFQQIEAYRIDPRWKMAAQEFPTHEAAAIGRDRPRTYAEQELWLLREQYAFEAGESPATPQNHSRRQERCPDWPVVVQRLWKSGLLAAKELALTAQGKARVEEERLLHPDGPPPAEPFRIHVAPIATGSKVVVDEEIFDRLSQRERRVFGLEMEAAAVAMVAHTEGVGHLLIAKGVQDYADHDKDDALRPFACRASADFLLRFLGKVDLRENYSRVNEPVSVELHMKVSNESVLSTNNLIYEMLRNARLELNITKLKIDHG